MSVTNPAMERFVSGEYEHGFVTAIESDTLPPGLDEAVIRAISARKAEPDWMLERRLQAYRHWQTMTEPDWAHLRHPPIDFNGISYYSAPKRDKDAPQSLDEIDPQLLETYR
ncbi:MAG TPA: Fe-S cluster assembly protein SufB, partial [Gammaproteobacteria bacterium]|nr:Fe-S cluster assembly protein SufB [Gammaproteobacteria bacterium]